ncbi:MAG: 16S rRNA (guanine(966)-N(2))-methyltransferase RsmD [Schleiferilactobacillus perolens]|uniref:16S rRNA (guanine(966)-N(2))-methyltransferase RsmD n=1 Tax=Schleiferilactobacillus perolens TaxID=100468 RepID=UPI0039E94CFC
MRIISGEFGGRHLLAVPGNKTRPTTDKIKENLFNIIGPYFSGGRVLDLFAGTGGLGIEAVSRGMDQAVLVDRQGAAIKVITRNVAVTKTPSRFTIMHSTAAAYLKRAAGHMQFDLVFLDPPYAKQQIVDTIKQLAQAKMLAPGAQIIAETDTQVTYPVVPQFSLTRQVAYGITELAIFQYEGE